MGPPVAYPLCMFGCCLLGNPSLWTGGLTPGGGGNCAYVKLRNGELNGVSVYCDHCGGLLGDPAMARGLAAGARARIGGGERCEEDAMRGSEAESGVGDLHDDRAGGAPGRCLSMAALIGFAIVDVPFWGGQRQTKQGG